MKNNTELKGSDNNINKNGVMRKKKKNYYNNIVEGK